MLIVSHCFAGFTAGKAYRLTMHENGIREIARLRNLRSTLLEMEQPGAIADDSEAIASCRADIRAIEIEWPDLRLIDAYEQSSREAGNPEVDALSAELHERGLAA